MCIESLKYEPKNYNKLANITKRKQAHRYREQTGSSGGRGVIERQEMKRTKL